MFTKLLYLFRKFGIKNPISYKIFFSNFLTGLIIYLFFLLFSYLEYIGERVDSFVDFFIKTETFAYELNEYKESKVNISTLEKPVIAFFSSLVNLNKEELNKITFVEIDRATLQNWKGRNYPITPRKYLADLLDKIAENNPKIIVVDILFDTKCNEENDKYLKEKLIDILEKKDIKIVLPVIIDPETTINSENKIIYPYFYDELKNNPKIKGKLFFGLPASYMSEHDKKVRFINFYQKVNNNNDVVWNLSLITYALDKNKFSVLEKTKDDILKDNVKSIELDFGSRKVVINNEDYIYPRLRFVYDNDYKNIVFASDLADNPKEFKKLLENKIVIVGVTDKIKNDYFSTPVGDMAGMYILGNQIYTISNLQVHHVNALIKPSLQILSIFIAALIFTIFAPFVATILSIAYLFILIIISMVLFIKYNIFINMIVPVFIMIIVKKITYLQEFLIKKNIFRYISKRK